MIIIAVDYRSAWKLAMNINPSDGNIMNYCNTLWHHDVEYGDASTALCKDFISKSVRSIPVNRIAIVRHNNRRPDGKPPDCLLDLVADS